MLQIRQTPYYKWHNIRAVSNTAVFCISCCIIIIIIIIIVVVEEEEGNVEVEEEKFQFVTFTCQNASIPECHISDI